MDVFFGNAVRAQCVSGTSAVWFVRAGGGGTHALTSDSTTFLGRKRSVWHSNTLFEMDRAFGARDSDSLRIRGEDEASDPPSRCGDVDSVTDGCGATTGATLMATESAAPPDPEDNPTGVAPKPNREFTPQQGCLTLGCVLLLLFLAFSGHSFCQNPRLSGCAAASCSVRCRCSDGKGGPEADG